MVPYFLDLFADVRRLDLRPQFQPQVLGDGVERPARQLPFSVAEPDQRATVRARILGDLVERLTAVEDGFPELLADFHVHPP